MQADLSLIRAVVQDGPTLEDLKAANPEKHRPPFTIEEVVHQLAPYPYVAITFDCNIDGDQFGGKTKEDAQAAVLSALWFPAGFISGDARVSAASVYQIVADMLRRAAK